MHTLQTDIYIQKRPINRLKRDLYIQKRPIHTKETYTYKRDLYIQKRPINRLKRDLYIRCTVASFPRAAARRTAVRAQQFAHRKCQKRPINRLRKRPIHTRMRT